MTFLNSIWLWLVAGTLAAAIPILIHLIRWRKPREVRFPSLEFLKDVTQAKVRRFQIRQLLLLILRVLIVALFALAMMRPAMHARGALGRGSTSIGIILDNSFSMSARDPAQSGVPSGGSGRLRRISGARGRYRLRSGETARGRGRWDDARGRPRCARPRCHPSAGSLRNSDHGSLFVAAGGRTHADRGYAGGSATGFRAGRRRAGSEPHTESRNLHHFRFPADRYRSVAGSARKAERFDLRGARGRGDSTRCGWQWRRESRGGHARLLDSRADLAHRQSRDRAPALGRVWCWPRSGWAARRHRHQR